MKPMSRAAKGMAKAIEYMNEHGWCKSQLRDLHGRVCLLGAIEGLNYDSRQTLIRVVAELFPHRISRRGAQSYTEFNDHPDTTRTDVNNVMKHALVLLIQEGQND